MNRRGFLHGILATAMAPAIVRSESLMKIVVPSQEIILIDKMAALHAADIERAIFYGNSAIIPEELARKSFAALITRLMPNGDAPLFNLQRGIYVPRVEE